MKISKRLKWLFNQWHMSQPTELPKAEPKAEPQIPPGASGEIHFTDEQIAASECEQAPQTNVPAGLVVQARERTPGLATVEREIVAALPLDMGRQRDPRPVRRARGAKKCRTLFVEPPHREPPARKTQIEQTGF